MIRPLDECRRPPPCTLDPPRSATGGRDQEPPGERCRPRRPKRRAMVCALCTLVLLTNILGRPVFRPAAPPPGRLVRLGVVLDTRNDPRRLVEIARVCDRAGFDVLWAADSVMGSDGPPRHDAWTALTVAAIECHRARLGAVLAGSGRAPKGGGGNGGAPHRGGGGGPGG